MEMILWPMVVIALMGGAILVIAATGPLAAFRIVPAVLMGAVRIVLRAVTIAAPIRPRLKLLIVAVLLLGLVGLVAACDGKHGWGASRSPLIVNCASPYAHNPKGISRD